MSQRHDVLFYAPTAGALFAAAGPPAGGAETQVAAVARELARRGVRVAFVVDRDDLPRTVDGIDLVVQPPARSRVPVVRALEPGLRTLVALVQANAPVVVQRTASSVTGLVALVARITRRRFVYSCASVVDFEWDRIEPNRANVRMFRLGIRLAHDIVVQTSEQTVLSRRHFGREGRLIRSAVEAAPPRRGTPDAFVWIGRLAEYKRPHAYLDLAQALPEARFRMLGVPSGPDGPRLAEEVATRAGSLANVELVAPRPKAELGSIYDSAVAVVNTAEFEGMPNIFLEGWARGVPALSLHHDPDATIVRERIGEFAGGDPALLVDQARRLWAERTDQRELSARCVEYVRREHSLEAVAEAWTQLVRDLTPDRSRS